MLYLQKAHVGEGVSGRESVVVLGSGVAWVFRAKPPTNSDRRQQAQSPVGPKTVLLKPFILQRHFQPSYHEIINCHDPRHLYQEISFS
jgi:hypothetical protein